MKGIRVWLCGVVLAVVLGGMVSCGTQAVPPTAGEVLAAMRAAMPEAPAGMVRAREVGEDSPDYLTGELFSALFGSACRGWLEAGAGEVPLMGDAAVFLPVALHPGELAVIRCNSAEGTVSAAAACETRLAALRAAWSEDPRCASLLSRAVIRIEEEYVLLVVADDPERVVEAGRRVIRGKG